ncbi:MAG: hypothetical protein LBN23_02820 [Paludibacter sp.]|jgi:cell division protein FtsA|nr:hypothetical protein [Paludibacter sp.]
MNKYVSFDLGNSKIAAMGAEILPDGKIKVLGTESVASNCVEHGKIVKPSEAAMKIGMLKRYLQNSSKLTAINGFGLAINARTMKAKEISINRKLNNKAVIYKYLEDMAKEARYDFDNRFLTVFDVIPQTYLLDGVAMDNPEGKKGKSLTGKYTIVYGEKSIKENIEKTAPRSVSTVDFDCLASEALSAALLSDDERQRGCAVIDFGAGNTTLSIYFDGVLKDLLVVPLGGKNITEDIMNEGVDEGVAETLKHQFPNVKIELPPTLDLQTLALIIEARLEELAVPVLDVIEKYKNKLLTGIVLTGGGSTPDYIVSYMQEKTGLPARRGSHAHLLADESKKYDVPSFSLLVGIIALWRSTIKENQTEAPKEPKRKRISPIKWVNIKLDELFPDFFAEDTPNKEKPQEEQVSE